VSDWEDTIPTTIQPGLASKVSPGVTSVRAKGSLRTSDTLAHKPDGSTERLLLVPNYNFDWQMSYRWEAGKKKLSKGTVMESVGHFDNSAFNPNPSASVRFGEQTFLEMLIGYYFYTRDDEDLGLAIDPATGHVRARSVEPPKGE
jgi:hypothetical protein